MSHETAPAVRTRSHQWPQPLWCSPYQCCHTGEPPPKSAGILAHSSSLWPKMHVPWGVGGVAPAPRPFPGDCAPSAPTALSPLTGIVLVCSPSNLPFVLAVTPGCTQPRASAPVPRPRSPLPLHLCLEPPTDCTQSPGPCPPRVHPRHSGLPCCIHDTSLAPEPTEGPSLCWLCSLHVVCHKYRSSPLSPADTGVGANMGKSVQGIPKFRGEYLGCKITPNAC